MLSSHIFEPRALTRRTSVHPVSFGHAPQAGRLFCTSLLGTVAFLAALAYAQSPVRAQTGERRTDLAVRQEFREPVTLTSKEGVLEVRLIARQRQAILDTVAKPVQNFLLFD